METIDSDLSFFFFHTINTYQENQHDGVLLVVCHDLEKEVACLVVLDAASLEVIASANAPAHIPMPLHGQFYELPE
jgi:carotenoid cleavage dioxygenase-like enzyme